MLYSAFLYLRCLRKKFNQTIVQEDIEEKLVDTTEIIKMLNNLNYSNYKGLYYEAQNSNSKMLDIYRNLPSFIRQKESKN